MNDKKRIQLLRLVVKMSTKSKVIVLRELEYWPINSELQQVYEVEKVHTGSRSPWLSKNHSLDSREWQGGGKQMCIERRSWGLKLMNCIIAAITRNQRIVRLFFRTQTRKHYSMIRSGSFFWGRVPAEACPGPNLISECRLFTSSMHRRRFEKIPRSKKPYFVNS